MTNAGKHFHIILQIIFCACLIPPCWELDKVRHPDKLIIWSFGHKDNVRRIPNVKIKCILQFWNKWPSNSSLTIFFNLPKQITLIWSRMDSWKQLILGLLLDGSVGRSSDTEPTTDLNFSLLFAVLPGSYKSSQTLITTDGRFVIMNRNSILDAVK